MPPLYGAEEFPYRTYDPYSAGRDALELARDYGRDRIRQIERMGDIRAEGIREVGENLARAPVAATQGYLSGREEGRRSRDEGRRAEESLRAEEGHRQDMAASKQAMEEGRRRLEAQDLSLGATRAEEAYLSQVDPKTGLTNRQLKAEMERRQAEANIKATEVGAAATQSSMGAAGLQRQSLVFDQNVREATALFSQAMSGGQDPQAVRQSLQAKGVPPAAIAEAENAARSQAANSRATQELFWKSGEGQRVVADLDQVEDQAEGIGELAAAASRYKDARWDSSEAKAAKRDFVRILSEKFGDEKAAEEIQGGLFGISADTRGFQLTGARMDEAINRVRQNADVVIRRARQNYGSLPYPEVQSRLQRVQNNMALSQAGLVTGNRPIDIFQNGAAPGGIMPAGAPAPGMPPQGPAPGAPGVPPVSRFRTNQYRGGGK